MVPGKTVMASQGSILISASLSPFQQQSAIMEVAPKKKKKLTNQATLKDQLNTFTEAQKSPKSVREMANEIQRK